MLRALCSHPRALGVRALNFKTLSRNLSVGVLGAPFCNGQRRPGVKDGPATIRATGVLKELQDSDINVKDYGDVIAKTDGSNNTSVKDIGPNGELQHQSVLSYNRTLSSRVSEIMREGRVCVTLGGDHSTAIGTIDGHAKADPSQQVVVLWVDAHADLNTGASSPSGNMHGMPVAHHLTHLAHSISTLPDGFPQPSLSASHVAYIGLRDVDPKEREFLNKLGIMNFGMSDVDRLGVVDVVSRCLEHLDPGKGRTLHMSFDIDVLDPNEAPSTGTPVRGGLSLREGLVLAEAVHESRQLKALDMVEVNPTLGTDIDAANTANAAKLLILAALVGRNS